MCYGQDLSDHCRAETRVDHYCLFEPTPRLIFTCHPGRSLSMAALDGSQQLKRAREEHIKNGHAQVRVSMLLDKGVTRHACRPRRPSAWIVGYCHRLGRQRRASDYSTRISNIRYQPLGSNLQWAARQSRNSCKAVVAAMTFTMYTTCTTRLKLVVLVTKGYL